MLETVIDATGPPTEFADQFVETRDVLDLLKIHRATLRAMINAGKFPEPRRDSAKSKQRWRRSEVDAWIESDRTARKR